MPSLNVQRVPTAVTRSHWRWIRRNLRARQRLWRCGVLDAEFFLTKRATTTTTSLDIPSATLNEFGATTDFLRPMRLFQGLERNDDNLTHHAQTTIDQLNKHRASLLLEARDGLFHLCSESFKDCPLIWYMGASYGLTPF